MDNVLSKVIAIILASILMFIVPVRIMIQKKNQAFQTYIYSETIKLVDSVRNTGKLTHEMYNNYKDNIQINNEIYIIKLFHGISSDNILTESEEASSNKNFLEFRYTKEILKCIENSREYLFMSGDIFRIEVRDKKGNVVSVYGGSIKDEDY